MRGEGGSRGGEQLKDRVRGEREKGNVFFKGTESEHAPHRSLKLGSLGEKRALFTGHALGSAPREHPRAALGKLRLYQGRNRHLRVCQTFKK